MDTSRYRICGMLMDQREVAQGHLGFLIQVVGEDGGSGRRYVAEHDCIIDSGTSRSHAAALMTAGGLAEVAP